MANWKVYLGRKNKNGALATYVIDLRYPDGSRKRPELNTTDEAQARALLEKWVKEVLPQEKHLWTTAHAEQAPIDVANPKISEVMDYYLKSHLVAANAAPSTLQHHEQILRDFELHCRDRHVGRVHQLNLKIINEHAAALVERKKAPKTVHNALATIRACLNAACQAGMLHASPVKTWIMPKIPDPEIQPLDATELHAVIALVREHEPAIYNIIQFMAFSGQRISDARGLKRNQLDLQIQVIYRTSTKTKKRIAVELGPDAMAALRREFARGIKTEYVFTDEGGLPFTRNYVTRAFQRAVKRKGKFYRHVRLHDLRHTFAYLLVNYTGCSLVTAQNLLGHETIKTTMRYCKPGPARSHLVNLGKLVKPKTTEKKAASGHHQVTDNIYPINR